jgi:hypothetical protein
MTLKRPSEKVRRNLLLNKYRMLERHRSKEVGNEVF